MTHSVKDINGKPYLTVMSRCHEYDGPEFVQEREELGVTIQRITGSKRKLFAHPKRVQQALDYSKKMMDRIKGECKGTKVHWDGSNCVHVVGKFAFLNSMRTFNGAVFNQIDTELRCRVCNNQFFQA